MTLAFVEPLLVRITKPTGDWLERERRRIDAEIASCFSGPPWAYVEPQVTRAEANARTPPSGPPDPVELDESVSYEQWIGLLYACAVFRGVLEHPPIWP